MIGEYYLLTLIKANVKQRRVVQFDIALQGPFDSSVELLERSNENQSCLLVIGLNLVLVQRSKWEIWMYQKSFVMFSELLLMAFPMLSTTAKAEVWD